MAAFVSGSVLLVEIGEILDLDGVIGESRNDLQFAAHRLDEAAECADIHIRPLLDLGDRSLSDLERLPNLLLRQLQGAAHLCEIHFLAKTLRLSFGLVLCLGRHAGAKLREGTPTGHRSSPSPTRPD